MTRDQALSLLAQHGELTPASAISAILDAHAQGVRSVETPDLTIRMDFDGHTVSQVIPGKVLANSSIDDVRRVAAEMANWLDVPAYEGRAHDEAVVADHMAAIRGMGCAVVVWMPEEIGSARIADLENVVIERGNEYLELDAD